jgi:hypothetical protein
MPAEKALKRGWTNRKLNVFYMAGSGRISLRTIKNSKNALRSYRKWPRKKPAMS